MSGLMGSKTEFDGFSVEIRIICHFLTKKHGKIVNLENCVLCTKISLILKNIPTLLNVPSSHWVDNRFLTAITMNLFDALHFYEIDDYHTKFGYADTMPKNNDYMINYDMNDKKRTMTLKKKKPGDSYGLAPFSNLAYGFFRSPCHYNGLMPELWGRYSDDYLSVVRRTFGWTKPEMNLVLHT